MNSASVVERETTGYFFELYATAPPLNITHISRSAHSIILITGIVTIRKCLQHFISCNSLFVAISQVHCALYIPQNSFDSLLVYICWSLHISTN
jgi:hypothetical protein